MHEIAMKWPFSQMRAHRTEDVAFLLLKIDPHSKASGQSVHCSWDVRSMFIPKCYKIGELFRMSKKSKKFGALLEEGLATECSHWMF
eukprot:2056206-Amphidinium_carterae.1